MKLKRILEFTPAFDKRHSDPKKNYGIHGVEMRFVVKGPLGAVQFLLYTNWQLKCVRKELEAQDCGSYCKNKPMPADLGYHSPTPMYVTDRWAARRLIGWMERSGTAS